ncbi:hypothetical protein F3J29_12740 [Enterobacter sp. Cy-643]|uniref:hypothetical protein n=1 Tax=Enterobacter sp. Cy-643 TaxID=2608346 RepID=UPI001420E6B4|nr:hypothetical protein [Enterobacter sp. Cy-643]NIF32997.1 hypothetical protein [Enterobacter sp. Cy-643]
MNEILMSKAGSIEFRATSGSPAYDYNSIHVSSANYGYIKAAAGTRVSISCPTSATILESGTNTHEFTMTTSGIQRFRVQSTATGLVNIMIQNMDDVSETVTGYMIFNDYKIGDGRILAIANTTGALADGVSPCSIYLLMEAESDYMMDENHALYRQPITSIRVSVPAPLKVAGYNAGENVEITLNSDNSAHVNILSDKAVSGANVVVTTPQSSGTYQLVEMTFVDF